MKRTVYLVLDSKNEPINGAVHATEEIAKGFKLNGEEIVPAKLSWPYYARPRPVKLCLRDVVSREKQKKGRGFSWLLGLSCGHSARRQNSKTSGRGRTTGKANCETCFDEGIRTGDKI